MSIGDRHYPAKLSEWSGDTFLLSFDDPDVTPGLLTFVFTGGSSKAAGFTGSSVPDTLTSNYGRFDRAP